MAPKIRASREATPSIFIAGFCPGNSVSTANSSGDTLKVFSEVVIPVLMPNETIRLVKTPSKEG